MHARSCPLQVALFVLVATCGSASADEICVSTGDELAQALALTSTNGFDNSIHVVAGTIVLSPTIYEYTQTGNHTLDIEGGWSPNCSAQSHDATLTVLDGAGAGDARMSLFTYGSGNITVRYLTFAHYTSSIGALLLESSTNGNGDLRVENCLFTDNVVGGSGDLVAALNQTGGAGANYFLDNSVVGNTIGGPRVAVNLIGGGTAATCSLCANNNTVSGNLLGDNSPGAVFAGSFSSKFYLANNVLWGNTGNGAVDLYVQLSGDVHPTLTDNDVGILAGNPVDPASSGNVAVNPQFVFAAHGDFRLQPTSPVRDAGDNTPPGTVRSYDVLGTTRIDGTAVDMGAYEYHEIIFADGFE